MPRMIWMQNINTFIPQVDGLDQPEAKKKFKFMNAAAKKVIALIIKSGGGRRLINRTMIPHPARLKPTASSPPRTILPNSCA